jgi:hypothetical protein
MAELARTIRELRPRYATQISEGETLQSTSVDSWEKLDPFKTLVHQWDKENAVLIRATFKDDEEYQNYTQRAFSIGDRTLREEVYELQMDIAFGLKFLRAIDNNLDLYAPAKVSMTGRYWQVSALIGIAASLVILGVRLGWDFSALPEFSNLDEATKKEVVKTFVISMAGLPAVVITAAILKILKLK